MARPKSDVLTKREAQIMKVLWDCGDLSSGVVRAKLPGNPHDSSVRTMLRVLVEKGYVRIKGGQRPVLYASAVPQAKLQKKAMRSLLQRFFGGSVEGLVQHLIEDEQLTLEQLTKLRQKFGSNENGRES